jgi:hypothetical protein
MNASIPSSNALFCESVVRHLAMVAGGEAWASRSFAMFTAYFDASGDINNGEAVIVAGFVASADSWLEWEQRWLHRLQQDGLAWLHMRELRSWTSERRNRLLQDLSTITADAGPHKFGVVVKNDSVDSEFSEEKQREWHINAYSYAGRTCAKEVRLWAKSWGGPLPELVFEKGDAGQDHLRKLLDSKGGYQTHHFRPKRDFKDDDGLIVRGAVPLQAADLLAHEVMAWLRAVKTQPPASQRDVPRLRYGIDRIPGSIGIAGRDYLRFLRDGQEQLHSLIMTTEVKVKTK